MAVQRFARPDRFVQARPNPDSFPFFLRTATLPLPLPRCPRAPSIFNQKITHANTKRAILHPSNIHSFGSAGSVFPSHTHTQCSLATYRLSTIRVAHPVRRVSASTSCPFGTSFSSARLVACSSVLPVLTWRAMTRARATEASQLMSLKP